MPKTIGEHYDELESKLLKTAVDEINKYLPKLTAPQRNLFDRMYPTWPRLPLEKMPWAYGQVRSAVDKNEEKKRDNFDVDKDAPREYALTDILEWG